MPENLYHTLPVDQTIENLNTDIKEGLQQSEVNNRLERFGKNILTPPPRKSPWKVLINQFNDILIYILVVAAIVTLILAMINSEQGDALEYYFDTVVIVVVLIINAALGFYQEMKAEIAVSSLASMMTEHSVVIRDAESRTVDAEDLVPGDVVILQVGERISADMRLVEATNLKVDESALTGESLGVNKTSKDTFPPETQIADQRNMVFMGTIIQTGKAKGIVTSTGESTEVGKISALVSTVKSTKTTLQRKLEEFSEFLAKLIVAAAAFLILFGLGVEYIAAGDDFNLVETALGLTVVGVSLAVAAIPEGLPIILTFALANSVQKMARKNAIIRKLQAVETLGATTFIATDKTGTLTQNQLTVTELVTAKGAYSVTGMDTGKSEKIEDLHNPSHEKLLETLYAVTRPLSNFSKKDLEDGQSIDPLDIAVDRALKDLNVNYPIELLAELPFDSDRKMMSVITEQQDEDKVLYLKGASDAVLNNCTQYVDENGNIENMTSSVHDEFVQMLEALADDGYRVIGCAFRPIGKNLDLQDIPMEIESELTFSGFITFVDPPRPEVYGALNSCYTAGIKVVMITGDHPKTALAIARDLKIANDENAVVTTGMELAKMTDDDLRERLQECNVFARVTPEHKLRLVNILQENGEIVAMTGDGVNDAPALIRADIGVAMGIAGTDAAKESSDMVLLDDNFATLVSTVEEGRSVNDNIKKFTNYLLASNTSEVLLLIFGFFVIAFFQPSLIRELIPLSESQILYLNLVTDSFLALALGLELKEKNIMNRDPKDPNEPIVTRSDNKRIIFIGLVLSILSIIVFFQLLGGPSHWTELSHERIAYVQSFTLTFLVFSEVFVAISYRSSEPVYKIGYGSNRFFVISVIAVIVAQIAILHIPLFNALFDTAPLSFLDWFIITMMSLAVFVILEGAKFLSVYNKPDLTSSGSV